MIEVLIALSAGILVHTIHIQRNANKQLQTASKQVTKAAEVYSELVSLKTKVSEHELAINSLSARNSFK